jgi:hypothetical protein
MELIQIKKRKIQARQFIIADEGSVFWPTKYGRAKAKDGDWLVTSEDGNVIIINKDAMEYLTSKDED